MRIRTGLAAAALTLGTAAGTVALAHTASATTSHSARHLVPGQLCQNAGGIVLPEEGSPTGLVCHGGDFDGEPVLP